MTAPADEPEIATSAKAPATIGADLVAVVACCLIWGTTWFAITFQLEGPGGHPIVSPMVSLVYRFGSAALILFGWLSATRKQIRLTPRQHLEVLLQGFFIFTINYACVYFAEERIVSAAAAVGFAGLAFLNLVLFRIFFAQKVPVAAWAASAAGVVGVAVMSWAELQRAHLDTRALVGLAVLFTGVVAAAVGNLFAHRAHDAGVEVGASTAWSMAYGAALLAVCAVVRGDAWTFDPSLGYGLSLAYLSLFGSVIGFVLYFGLARRRGYGFASYISAITPPIAMAVSAVFEHARWGIEAVFGVGLVVLGQILLIRAKKA
ncbi:MAG TPA: EamA family transporter [Caulobacteraceae bacterium]|jgi:drug/metabolite transporter (DMT)-like permease|nr:EamA family transporter [Caulobacteraceae bacterium]